MLLSRSKLMVLEGSTNDFYTIKLKTQPTRCFIDEIPFIFKAINDHVIDQLFTRSFVGSCDRLCFSCMG